MSIVKHNQNNIFKIIYKNLFAIAIALFIAIIFRSFFFQSFVIPSGSMKPNLLIGDYIFVNKSSFGYSRYSMPFAPSVFGDKRLFYKQPSRGDIVVFKHLGNDYADYVKRVIGLPGDKIQIIGGEVYINNKPLTYQTIGTEEKDNTTYTVLKETLPSGKSYKIYRDYNVLTLANNTPPYYIKKDHFFMMGDNRDYSKDSRYQDVGQISKSVLEGKASVVFFSIKGGSFLQFWKWDHIRFNRIFKVLN